MPTFSQHPRPRAGGRRPSRRSATIVGAGLVGLALAAAVGGATLRDTRAAPGVIGVPVPAVHVHGIGLDPADGALYAGTHTGLFRIGPASAERVGASRNDLMGFTVLGPRRYLASGHPDHGTAAEANLGLVETSDAGATWRTVSLAGEADFHVLTASGGMIYAVNRGQIQASADGGRSWRSGATLLVAALAVDPTDSATVLATTENGPGRSTDGARSFRRIADAPLLQLLSWPTKDLVVGVAPDGRVYTSTDSARTWVAGADVGAAPEALTATPDAIYVAVEGAVLLSTDAGRSFTRYATLG